MDQNQITIAEFNSQLRALLQRVANESDVKVVELHVKWDTTEVLSNNPEHFIRCLSMGSES